MKTKNGITVRFVRSNEVNDVYHINGNGYSEYRSYPRTCNTSIDNVFDEILT